MVVTGRNGATCGVGLEMEGEAVPGEGWAFVIVLQWLIRYSLVRMTDEEARQYSQYEEGGNSPYDLYGALRIVIIISSDLQF